MKIIKPLLFAFLTALLSSCFGTKAPVDSPKTNLSKSGGSSSKSVGLFELNTRKDLNIESVISTYNPDKIEIISGGNNRKTLSGNNLDKIKSVKVQLPQKGERIIIRVFRKNKLLVTKALK
ncbi:MAG: hypothetical protein CME61_05530 [Halobacteriovoraceae bacterium]|nr:hypothetical protein [Halobacteriovoraceae bacterium]